MAVDAHVTMAMVMVTTMNMAIDTVHCEAEQIRVILTSKFGPIRLGIEPNLSPQYSLDPDTDAQFFVLLRDGPRILFRASAAGQIASDTY